MNKSSVFKIFSFILVTGFLFSGATVFSLAQSNVEVSTRKVQEEIISDEELINQEDEAKISIPEIKLAAVSSEERMQKVNQTAFQNRSNNFWLWICIGALVLSTMFVNIKKIFHK